MADYDGITQPTTGNPGSSGKPGPIHTIDAPTQTQPWGQDNYKIDNTNQRGGDRTSPSLGDLGRNYNFGNTYTNLSFERDPFIHLLTKFKKKPTDDFKFEYAIKRKLANFKRYGYCMGVNTDSDAALTADATLTTTEASWGDAALVDALASTQGDYVKTTIPAVGEKCNLLMMGDYKTHGNITNKIGRDSTNGNVLMGAQYTRPSWFLKNQVVRIPTTAGSPGGDVSGYCLVRVLTSYGVSIENSGVVKGEAQDLYCVVLKNDGTNDVPTSIQDVHGSATLPDVNPGATQATSVAGKLEPMRSYISGTAYHELSGYGDTWRQQPFTTDYGQTQIFKKTAMMSGRAMATKLKFGENPWKNEWEDKMTEMTWEIGQAGYFGEQYVDDDGITYTEGIVNFILNNGNSFTWSDSHTVDDYLEQLSAYHDPRYMVGGKQKQVYFCNTEVWNWHAKLGGFMKNNAEISPNYNVQFSGTGKMAGVKYRTFDVDGTSIKLVRDIHLDQTHVKMIAANMSACAVRPLVGNGVNRDVTVYPGVKTVKNSGEDYRVDLIQGDIGFEFSAPETHAVWL
jgi:hypothetical protein